MTIWAIVPAAGVGSRMAAGNPHNLPKQYRPLGEKTVLSHTLGKLLAVPDVVSVTVAIGAEDGYWQSIPESTHSRVHTVIGGTERMFSVLNALQALKAERDDWVLVHDAVRPCVLVSDIERLIAHLKDHPVGGLLGCAVDNTIKQIGAQGEVVKTVDRDSLCNALTPQMFRFGVLQAALQRASELGLPVTDEASAVELAGLQPQLVLGDKSNIKITHEGDLALAELLLSSGAE